MQRSLTIRQCPGRCSPLPARQTVVLWERCEPRPPRRHLAFPFGGPCFVMAGSLPPRDHYSNHRIVAIPPALDRVGCHVINIVPHPRGGPFTFSSDSGSGPASSLGRAPSAPTSRALGNALGGGTNLRSEHVESDDRGGAEKGEAGESRRRSATVGEGDSRSPNRTNQDPTPQD